MKFKFKIQQYQTDAVECIARVFDGVPGIDIFKQLRNTYSKNTLRKVL